MKDNKFFERIADLKDDIEKLKELKVKKETEEKILLKELKHKYGIGSIEEAIKVYKKVEKELEESEEERQEILDNLAKDIDDIMDVYV